MESLRRMQIPAGEFKARCLQLMDEVDRNGIEIVITKRGRPVARLVRASEEKLSPIGWMKGQGRILGDVVKSDPTDWPDSPLLPPSEQ